MSAHFGHVRLDGISAVGAYAPIAAAGKWRMLALGNCAKGACGSFAMMGKVSCPMMRI